MRSLFVCHLYQCISSLNISVTFAAFSFYYDTEILFYDHIAQIRRIDEGNKTEAAYVAKTMSNTINCVLLFIAMAQNAINLKIHLIERLYF